MEGLAPQLFFITLALLMACSIITLSYGLMFAGVAITAWLNGEDVREATRQLREEI